MRKSFTQVRHGFTKDAVQALESNPPTKNTRWVIGGMMGSGKTTLAKWLASAWDIPHVEIDRFTSRDDVVHHVTIALRSGWIAEANPWQVPEEIWSCADWIVFLDFDNIVNYWRLIRRGLSKWRSSGQRWNGFREHVIDDAIKDLCRIVYRHGESNRDDWRRNGMGGGETCTHDRCLRCISPAEVKLLCSIAVSKWIPSPNFRREVAK
jgi:adenylate kinase family enzyme